MFERRVSTNFDLPSLKSDLASEGFFMTFRHFSLNMERLFEPSSPATTVRGEIISVR